TRRVPREPRAGCPFRPALRARLAVLLAGRDAGNPQLGGEGAHRPALHPPHRGRRSVGGGSLPVHRHPARRSVGCPGPIQPERLKIRTRGAVLQAVERILSWTATWSSPRTAM